MSGRFCRLLLITLACAVLLAAWLPAPGAGQAGAEGGSADAAAELAQTYRPIVLMKEQTEACDTDGEAWDPAPVDIVLGNPEVRLLGPEGELVTTAPTARDLFEAGPDFNLDFPGNSLNPGCTYEMDYQRFKQGRPDVVYAHVTSEEGVEDRLVLQYWFYWYFNDFNNTHESDWEMMQIVFPAATAEEALQVEPIEVGLAQHAGGERAEWDDDKVQKEGVRPVVYPAAGSHATYYSGELFLGRGASTGFGCDDSTGPHRRADPEPRLIPTEVSDPDAPDAWVAWEGRWGQRERGSFDGPTGPITKKQWTEPITWQDGLRSRSTEVPGRNVFGPTTTQVFCDGVAIGSSLFVAFGESPIPGIVLIGTIVLLFGGAARATRWSPAGPLPLRRVRGLGQILRAARRMYARHATTFITAGLVFIPLTLLVVAFQGVVSGLEPWQAGEQAGGDEETFSLALAPIAGGLMTAIAAAIVNAVAATTMREADGGRPATVLPVLRETLRAVRCFVPPVLGATAVITALVLTIVGIPVAIWLLVRWLFITPAAIIDGRCGWDAPRRSVDVVRRRWFRTAWAAAVINLIAIATGPLLALVLLFVTEIPLIAINMFGALMYALVVPYAAIATAYLYLSNGERAAERSPS